MFSPGQSIHFFFFKIQAERQRKATEGGAEVLISQWINFPIENHCDRTVSQFVCYCAPFIATWKLCHYIWTGIYGAPLERNGGRDAETKGPYIVTGYFTRGEI